MNATLTLGKRSLREALRQPDALFMTMFIPIFFLVVNTGQAAKVFPSDSTGFLEGQGYGAFQLPITLLLAASFGMAALFLVEEIEGGYFDKLRAMPIPRYSMVLGRLASEAVKGVVLSSLIVLLALPFGITIASGPLGFVLLIALSTLWGVVYAGFMQLIALKTRSAAATNSGGLIFFPLLFLTPNFVPRDMLARPMEIAATLNPVTYLMEALLADPHRPRLEQGPPRLRRRRGPRGDHARAQREDDSQLRLALISLSNECFSAADGWGGNRASSRWLRGRQRLRQRQVPEIPDLSLRDPVHDPGRGTRP